MFEYNYFPQQIKTCKSVAGIWITAMTVSASWRDGGGRSTPHCCRGSCAAAPVWPPPPTPYSGKTNLRVFYILTVPPTEYYKPLHSHICCKQITLHHIFVLLVKLLSTNNENTTEFSYTFSLLGLECTYAIKNAQVLLKYRVKIYSVFAFMMFLFI